MKLSRRHRRTLGKILEERRRAESNGGKCWRFRRSGSRSQRGTRLAGSHCSQRSQGGLSQPHPGKEMDKGSLGSMERFLIAAASSPGRSSRALLQGIFRHRGCPDRDEEIFHGEVSGLREVVTSRVTRCGRSSGPFGDSSTTISNSARSRGVPRQTVFGSTRPPDDS